MFHRRAFASLVAGVLTVSCIAQLSAVTAVEGSYNMNVTVNLAGEKKEISPYIYGVNEYGNANNLKNISVNAVRQGGNRYTGYNWETNYSNAGEDWLQSSDTNIGDITDGPAYAAQRLSESCQKYNVPYKMTTLQMAGYVSADKNGTVAENEAAPSARWNKVEFRKNGELSLTPDLEDGTVYMDEYVNYLVQTLGDSTTGNGIQGYNLDNEPVLWNDTHPLIHGDEVSNSELISKSIELASVVKDIDPNAEVFGPAFWGMLPCIQAGNGNTYTDPDWAAVQNDYSWYMDYYLKQMADAEQEYGKRLLDVVDVHYYAQDCSTDEGRLQAARSLYDPDYKENSWLQPYFGGYFPFLTRLQESIDKYYPGTKLALTEYNLANIADEKNTGKSVVSAITQTETLGAFADQGVYLATYWGTLPECPYVEAAFNLYTNYDGEGAAFGDTLVEAQTEDLSKATAFAAIDGTDDSEVTLVLSNKSMTDSEQATISLEGASTDYQSAVVYAITQESSDIKIIDVQNDISGNQVTVELPPLSVAQIVISNEKTDKTITEEPNIRTEEVIYQYSDLEISENGFPMIPLGDKEHLKEIVINTTVTSNAGSTWCSGGGAFCFNKVVQEGSSSEVWGNKSFGYSLGNGDTIVPFDDQFTIVENEKSVTITGSCNDTYSELQNWWVSSENDPKAGSDITVTFNTIKLVYEYDNDTPETTTTTPAVTTTTEETETTTTEAITSEENTDTTSSVEPSTETSQTSTEATTSVSSSLPSSAILYGDVTLDGRVDITDAVLLNKAAAGQVTFNEQAQVNADCDGNGELSNNDALVLLKFLVHLVQSLPSAE
ncbi:glycoside hydrolase family 44 protein [uncultured Ruminococcus sp.]|uniref:glycoside hydrolase family 44 protein n=1 Tax=uncultured Ruminococcus sp. TaxID=165186 RepID=UPI00261AB00F|nr:glycoside hydrolase family 44 protein [uncultured Ruminococcus sp.]